MKIVKVRTFTVYLSGLGAPLLQFSYVLFSRFLSLASHFKEALSTFSQRLTFIVDQEKCGKRLCAGTNYLSRNLSFDYEKAGRPTAGAFALKRVEDGNRAKWDIRYP